MALDRTVPAGIYEANIAIDTVANAQLDMGKISTSDKVDFTAL